MRSREVIFSISARNDLDSIYDAVRSETSRQTAGRFIGRIEAFCRSLDIAAERGMRHARIGHGVRSLGFERSLTIIIDVEANEVRILRIFRAGRDWEREFED